MKSASTLKNKPLLEPFQSDKSNVLRSCLSPMRNKLVLPTTEQNYAIAINLNEFSLAGFISQLEALHPNTRSR